jgi:uncharacterized protein (TIGR03086 family)
MPVRTVPDLTPAARRMADLVLAVPDGMLGEPTPCPDYTLGDLLDHVGGLAVAFTDAARKAGGDAASEGDASRLEEGWRTRIARDLRAMADAWSDPQAWTGMTKVGGVEMPAEMIGLVGLDELVVHGWDVARATRQPYACDTGSLEGALGFLEPMAAPGMSEQRGTVFGPVVEVAADSSLLDRVIGLSGRQPAW